MTKPRIGSKGAPERRRPLGAAASRWCKGLVPLLACTPLERDVDLPSEVIDIGPNTGAATLQAGCVAERYPIVFTSTRGASAVGLELYVMSLDGEVQQIGRTPRFIAPAWAPDGRSVAYRHQVAAEEGVSISSEVQLIATDGTERVALTAPETLPFGHESILPRDAPSWSPDGQRLAFAVADEANVERVWLVPRAGGEPQRLLRADEASHHSPSWAPEPSTIAIVAEPAGVEDIWLVHVEASERLGEPGARNLTNGSVLLPRSLRWSPDGRRLAFSALDPLPPGDGGGDFEVYVLELATAAITPLTRNDVTDLHPEWSPDGTELLITRGELADEVGVRPLDAQGLQLWRVPLDDPEGAIRLTFEGWMNCSADWFAGACGPR